ncbi:uncharacterized protein C8Q71DRAFT_910353 [Rhodofomes roseus]|uniref:Uncharacterized protein n=1 Tax=Rhodofomes roseus TaxID=34475 RepID=A0ABQ8K5F5_9APHY|nr:uncharacterized protein C8Q71DRAFT_910353 [Rhodofomes roseus]KAH9831987.1 hypothetical protein C8Q71DRAFT_910353 [Rhodofomes roseus]
MAARILNCRELMDEIFSHFATRIDSSGEYDPEAAVRNKWNPTLVNTALAGKALYEPALDVLWSHLDNLDPLLALLGTWKHRKQRKWAENVLDSKDDPIQILTDKLSHERFARFQHHARRVVSTNGLNRSAVHMTIWRSLSSMAGGRPLLPRLRRAIWYLGSVYEVDLLLLIPPTLRFLDVQHWNAVYGPEHLEGMMRKIKRALGSRDHVSDQMAIKITEAAPDLTRIRICTPGFRALAILSWFRNLSELTINCTRECILPGGGCKVLFPQLRSLEVYAPVDSLNALLATVDCPKLRHCSVRPHPSCGTDRLQECFEIMVRAFGTLESVKVRGWRQKYAELEADVSVPLAATAVRVLSQLRYLRSVELSGCPRFWRDGLSLDSMFKAWPCLRSLKLTLLEEVPGDFYEYETAAALEVGWVDLGLIPSPSLQTLLEIPRWCPDLRVLEIPVVEVFHLPKAYTGPPVNLPVARFWSVKTRKAADKQAVWDAINLVSKEAEVYNWLGVWDEEVPGRDPLAPIMIN